ncbi:MAG: histidine phosphatase family protein [Firmicutes bacterium]|nr:histidine phosphatase family protein [Bacillota bacterium]
MIYLLRHGETDFNVKNLLMGQLDIPLNANGISQAHSAITDVTKIKFDYIFSSDLARARQTAEIINKHLNLNITFDKRLREVGLGELQGRERKNITACEWEKFNERPELFGGEPWCRIFSRAKSFIHEISSYKGDILVVGHSGLFKIMMCYADNKNFKDFMRYFIQIEIPHSKIQTLGYLKSTNTRTTRKDQNTQ